MGSLPAQTGITAVAIDPKDPRRVYAAAPSGVYRSNDAGRTWQSVGQGLPKRALVALAPDPREPRRLYAATPTGALYLSEDGANSWQALPGTGGRAGR